MPEIIKPQQPTTIPSPIVQPKRPDRIRLVLIISFIFLLTILAIFASLVFFKKIQIPFLTQTKPTSKIQIPCPSISEFCQKPNEVLENGGYAGIGSNVEAGSPIFAVFDGQIEIRGVSGPGVGDEEFVQVTIRNDQQKLKAVYYLKDTDRTIFPKFPTVKKGEVIATVSAETIKYFNNYNLMFTLTDEQDDAIPFEKISFE